MLSNITYLHGYLSLLKDNTWEFVTRDCDGKITNTIDISDIQYSWKMCIQENTFDVGWSFDAARRLFGYSCHVSAKSLSNTLALPNLSTALAPSNPD